MKGAGVRVQGSGSRVVNSTKNSELTTLNSHGEAVCIGCGCTDSRACAHPVIGPCFWVKVDYKLGIGVCSECVEKVEEFEERVNQARLVSHGDAETRRTA